MKYRQPEDTRRTSILQKKRGLNIDHLIEVVKLLAEGRKMLAKNKDHALIGNYKDCRECHIDPDWLLIYKKDDILELLTLIRTGTHSDLFK